MSPPADTGRRPRSPAWERALSLALRTLHLVAVVVLGAALMGAPVSRHGAGSVLLVSGLALLVLDLLARRIHLLELAGAVVLVKLAASAWLAWGSGGERPLFWALVVLSSLSAHAPKSLRHWRPGQSRSSKAGSPG